MNYKLKESLKKSKWVFIIMLAIWIGLSILLSAPIAVASVESKATGIGDSNAFFEKLFSVIGDVGGNLGKIFRPAYIKAYLKVEGFVSLGVLFFFVVGIIKSMPKNEYSGIENGSSDWASGEQYSVLSKKKGILLAENHYLPVDKRGNTNVLVVGRFWFSENLHLTLFQMHTNY